MDDREQKAWVNEWLHSTQSSNLTDDQETLGMEAIGKFPCLLISSQTAFSLTGGTPDSVWFI